MKKFTIILYDGGFKDSAPALLSLKNQSILSDIEVIWIEYGNKIYNEVSKYDFIKRVKLGMTKPIDISYCYNTGLSMATGKYFMLVDPCLYFKSDTLQKIYEYHEKNENRFTWNKELRGNNIEFRKELTTKYYKDINPILLKDNLKLKNGNMGCMSCTLTSNYRDVNGFDTFDYPVTNHLKLCMIRMMNKFGLQTEAIDHIVYHPFHPRGKKANKDMMKRIVNSFKNKKTVMAEKGLHYMKNNYTLKRDNNVYTLEKI